jgi:hypothetical protein
VTGLPGDHRTGIDLNAETILHGPTAWLRTMTTQATLSYDAGDGLAALYAGLGRQIANTVRVDVRMGWFRQGGYTLDIGITTVMPGPRFGSRNQFRTGTGTDGILFVDGSVIVDPDSRLVRFSDGRDLGRAGVSGVVFFDLNGNGIRDPDERGLEDVPVRVGGWFDETDAEGRFAAWDLFPYEASFVYVDSLAFDDPRLVLPNPVVQVHPTPNSFSAIEVPVVVGAEVSGYVFFEDAGLPSAPVVLRNLQSGTSVALTSFGDGGFYRAGVPPGDYVIVVPAAFLDQINATAMPLEISIPHGMGEKRFEDLIVTVRRRPQQ